MRILVVDVGGTNVKLLATGQTAPVKLPSGPALGPAEMVAAVRAATADWDCDVISIGYPGPVRGGLPARDPHNLGPGWVGFDFAAAFGRPVKIVNDAGMQALGSYEGGHMLFLGFGTGLGSALVVDGVLTALELAHLPYRHGQSFEDYVGARGLRRLGPQRWRRHVDRVTRMLMQAMNADYTIVGGGNTKRLRDLPPNVRRGSNAKAFVGGFRLWRGLGDSAAER